MNLASRYNISDIIRELETALQLDGSDFEERDVNVVIKNVKNRIRQQYSVDLTNVKITSVDLEIGVQRNATEVFVDNIVRIHALLCGWCQIVRYKTSINISVSSVNNFGFTPESLRGTLKKLQCESTSASVSADIQAIKSKLAAVSVCKEKRLMMILIIAYELGFTELSASIAEILCLSQLVGH